MKWTIVGVDLSTNDVIDLKDSNFSEANNSIISDFILDSLLGNYMQQKNHLKFTLHEKLVALTGLKLLYIHLPLLGTQSLNGLKVVLTKDLTCQSLTIILLSDMSVIGIAWDAD